MERQYHNIQYCICIKVHLSVSETSQFSHQICQSWHPQTPGNVDRRQRATPSAVSQAPRVRPSFRPRLQQVDGQHTGGDAQAVGDGGEWNGIIDIISWSDLFYDVAHYQ